MCDLSNWYWQLSDGRVWSTAAAAFVDAAQASDWLTFKGFTAIPSSPVDDSGEQSESGLHAALMFYGLSLGALATTEEMAATIRSERDQRITATDYLAMPDYPLSDESLAAVKSYRQTLRDLPTQDGFPWGGDISAAPWPEMPAITTTTSESTVETTAS